MELARAITYEVDACDVAPDAVWGLQAFALRAEGSGGFDNMARDDAVAQDSLLVVDVCNKQIEGLDSLLEPLIDAVPFLAGDNSWKDIEGEDFLLALLASVDVEGDTHVEENRFGGDLSLTEVLVVHVLEGLEQQVYRGARLVVRSEVFVKNEPVS